MLREGKSVETRGLEPQTPALQRQLWHSRWLERRIAEFRLDRFHPLSDRSSPLARGGHAAAKSRLTLLQVVQAGDQGAVLIHTLEDLLDYVERHLHLGSPDLAEGLRLDVSGIVSE